jgi:hypothetical protein
MREVAKPKFQLPGSRGSRINRVGGADDAQPGDLQALCRGVSPLGEDNAGGEPARALEIAQAWNDLAEGHKKDDPRSDCHELTKGRAEPALFFCDSPSRKLPACRTMLPMEGCGVCAILTLIVGLTNDRRST